MEPHLEQIRAKLQILGLLMPKALAGLAIAAPLAVALAPILVGLVKIMLGVSRDKPVVFLVAFCLVNLVLALILFAKAPSRTRFGSAHLQALRNESREWNHQSAATQIMPAENLMMGVALYGLGSLADSTFSDFKRSVEPRAGSSSCGGGCGSSDGGGDGDGGGGGGCGGCGGGGD